MDRNICPTFFLTSRPQMHANLLRTYRSVQFWVTAEYDTGSRSPQKTSDPEGHVMAHRFTIGVEEEFQIIDPATCELRSHVSQLVSAASPDIASRSSTSCTSPSSKPARASAIT